MLSFLPPCFLASSPSIFTPGIPQKPQSTASHVRPCRSACWRRQLRPAARHLPPAALGTAASSAPPLGAGPGAATHHVHVVSRTAWGMATLQPPHPQPPYILWQHHSPGFHWGFTYPHCSGNRDLMVSAIFLELGFPKKPQPMFSSVPPPPSLQGRHKISCPPARQGFFSSKHQLQQLTQCSWGVEVTGKSPS